MPCCADVSCVVDAAIAHENRMRQIHPRPKAGYKEGARLWWGYACACVLEDVRERKGTKNLAAMASMAKEGKRYVMLFKKLLNNAADAAVEERFDDDER